MVNTYQSIFCKIIIDNVIDACRVFRDFRVAPLHVSRPRISPPIPPVLHVGYGFSLLVCSVRGIVSLSQDIRSTQRLASLSLTINNSTIWQFVMVTEPNDCVLSVAIIPRKHRMKRFEKYMDFGKKKKGGGGVVVHTFSHKENRVIEW